MSQYRYPASPGGGDPAPEFSTIELLLEGYRLFWQADPAPLSFGLGETGTGPYRIGAATYSYNNGSPFFQIQWNPVSGAIFYDRYRFAAGLLSLGDPSQIIPTYHTNLTQIDQTVWDSERSFITSTANTLLGLMMANLCPGAYANGGIASGFYTYGPKAGQSWGFTTYGTYTPSGSDQALGRPTLSYQGTFRMSGSEDATLAISTAGETIGQTTVQAPMLVVQAGTQEASWTNLTTGVGSLADQLTVLSDLTERQTPGLDVPTHPDDVLQTGNLAMAPGGPPQIFAQGASLPALVAVPTSIALLSSAPAITVVATAALGMLASTIYNSGIVGQAVSWLTGTGGGSGTIAQIANGVQTISQGTPYANQVNELISEIRKLRIAVEAIQGEVVRVEGDPTKPGLVTAVELASQARSEIILKSHGQEITCSTGVVIEAP